MITIPDEMAAQIVALVEHRKFSAFARQALAHELDGTTNAQWLDERRIRCESERQSVD